MPSQKVTINADHVDIDVVDHGYGYEIGVIVPLSDLKNEYGANNYKKYPGVLLDAKGNVLVGAEAVFEGKVQEVEEDVYESWGSIGTLDSSYGVTLKLSVGTGGGSNVFRFNGYSGAKPGSHFGMANATYLTYDGAGGFTTGAENYFNYFSKVDGEPADPANNWAGLMGAVRGGDPWKRIFSGVDGASAGTGASADPGASFDPSTIGPGGAERLLLVSVQFTSKTQLNIVQNTL